MAYKYQPLFGGWYIESQLGKGASGEVYKVYKEELGFKYYSALKVITLPSSEQINWYSSFNSLDDKVTFKRYIDTILSNAQNEINTLYKFRGNSYITSYEDHLIVPREDIGGYDILLRMELAKSVKSLSSNFIDNNKEIFKLGKDILNALVTCHKNDIIHRDLKEDNIFLSDSGYYKLGDFGIAKKMESKMISTVAGTYLYMSPEVYSGQKYNEQADLYSLGIVLYKLFNNGRYPFIPQDGNIDISQIEKSQSLRLSGTKIPNINNVSSSINAFLQKALAFNPKDRFETAIEMLRDLVKLERKELLDEQEELNFFESAEESLLHEKEKSKEKLNMLFLASLFLPFIYFIFARVMGFSKNDNAISEILLCIIIGIVVSNSLVYSIRKSLILSIEWGFFIIMSNYNSEIMLTGDKIKIYLLLFLIVLINGVVPSSIIKYVKTWGKQTYTNTLIISALFNVLCLMILFAVKIFENNNFVDFADIVTSLLGYLVSSIIITGLSYFGAYVISVYINKKISVK